MKTHLYITPYNEQSELRRNELEMCLRRNLDAGFSFIHVILEEKDVAYFHNSLMADILIRYPISTMINILPKRPTFQDYLDVANAFPDSHLHTVMNTDIYMPPESLKQLQALPWERNLFVALARYDLTTSGKLILLDRWDSADTWVWRGTVNVENINCSCGNPGVDNHIAWKFKAAGYHVVNPSRDIVTVHVHNVHINNYREGGNPNGAVKADQICPEPYAFHTPIKISEI